MSTGNLTALELAARGDGARVKDNVGDVWEKRDGWWVCLDASLRGEQLLTIWGPVTPTTDPANLHEEIEE